MVAVSEEEFHLSLHGVIDEVEAARAGYAKLAIWDEVSCKIGGVDCGDERSC